MKKYDFKLIEKKWQDYWRDNNIFKFDPQSPKPIFSIDTPPPTVSGRMHLGHVFSYTQTEIIARFFRMAGYNVFYPIGMDDNGLPTDKLAEKELGIKSTSLPRDEYRQQVQTLVSRYHQDYMNLFNSLGFSFDWHLLYSTISSEVQELTLKNFEDFKKRNIIYKKKAPCLWCPACGTGVAQAEVEDRELETVFYDLQFGDLIISTTRPELLPACVAVFVHPDDVRYQRLIGTETTTSLGDKVKILADGKVKPDKGTGAVMICTYGDETDWYLKNKYQLDEKIIIDEQGRIDGLTIPAAREKIIKELKSQNLVVKETPLTHDVGVHERCGTIIEIILREQYFLKVLEIKEEILAMAETINWYPAFMKERLIDWVKNLKWDWCLSRERPYGIPIPGEDNLVFDTWFTSANTPEINTLKGGRIPYSLRPQAYEIIRTWAFYTLVLSYYKKQGIPWQNVAVSGHLLLRRGEKISKKNGGGNLRPEDQIATYSADAVRWAVSGVSLGADAYYDTNEVVFGQRVVTKLLSAANFVSLALTGFQSVKDQPELPLDRWLIAQSEITAHKMAEYFKHFDYNHPRDLIQTFFWSIFCDNYLEMIKKRIYGLTPTDHRRLSAQLALSQGFLNILIMFTPFIPHVTEEIFQSIYHSCPSIHQLSWPELKIKAEDYRVISELLAILSLVRGKKSSAGLNLASPIKTLIIKHPNLTEDDLIPYQDDFQAATQAQKIELEKSDHVAVDWA